MNAAFYADQILKRIAHGCGFALLLDTK